MILLRGQSLGILRNAHRSSEGKNLIFTGQSQDAVTGGNLLNHFMPSNQNRIEERGKVHSINQRQWLWQCPIMLCKRKRFYNQNSEKKKAPSLNLELKAHFDSY